MKKLSIFFLLIFCIVVLANAQETISTSVKTDKVSLGIGFGFDYGGYGGNLLIYPQKNIGLFFGGGYAIAGFGYNCGFKFRLISKNSNAIVNPYFTAMYGYNAVVYVKNATNYNKFFYGPTVGIGLDFHNKSGRVGYWTLGLLVPLRDSRVDDYIDDLKSNHGVEFKNELMPIGISLGYRFVIGQ